MNETARTLMQRIYEASFAVDDIVLYLDTHPDDMNALNYYNYVVHCGKKPWMPISDSLALLQPTELRAIQNGRG